MLKRSLRIKIMAAVFSASFLFGINSSDAYTYSDVISTIDNIIEDENDLSVTNNSSLNLSNDVMVRKIKTEQSIVEDVNSLEVSKNDIIALNPETKKAKAQFISCMYALPSGSNLHIYTIIANLPTGITQSEADEIITKLKETQTGYEYSNTIYNLGSVRKYGIWYTDQIKYLNQKYGLNIFIGANWGEREFNKQPDIGTRCKQALDSLKYNNESFSCDDYGSGGFGDYGSMGYQNEQIEIKTGKTIVTYKKNIGLVSITISNNSSLNTNGNVSTDKNIKVVDNSFLKAAGSITGGDVYSDKAIISTTDDQGESIITPGNITATGALKSDTYIGAVSGAVSGNTVYSGGDIVSTNSIKAGGLAKGNAFNVAAVNASSASITGNQSISGIFTTTGQAKLNGGAALGGKKITGLGIGTLSTSSTDAVNGKQLYTAMQSSGKTYAAGSDISISSANAISVAKAGKVASGNTGIMTGDAVYQETSKIDSVFKSHNTSITSNNSKLDSLTTSIESLRKSLGTINSSVSDAISGLPGSLANFANKDLTDLSDTGINTLKSYIKSEIKKQMPSNTKTASYAMEGVVTKDTSAIDNVIASKANTSDLTAMGSKVDSKADKSAVSLVGDNNNAKADLGYVNDGLDKKADKSVVEAVGRDVDKNTSATAKNTASIQSNTEAISGLIDSKADVFGSNIDVSSWSNKLGTGTVAKDDIGLVTGSSVAAALDKKADIGYVAIGLGAMEGSLEQVNQSVTKDVSRVGAGASALMGLHPTGDKFEFATAYGHYKNSNNTALGVFYKPSTNSTVSVAGTIGDGDAMLSAGVSVKLGLNKEVKKVITPNEFSEMKSAVDSQDEKLDQMEKTLQQLMAR